MSKIMFAAVTATSSMFRDLFLKSGAGTHGQLALWGFDICLMWENKPS